MERKEPPYKKRPTETLFLPVRGDGNRQIKVPVPVPVPVVNMQPRVKRQLDEETRRKILDYITNRKNFASSDIINNNNNNNNNNRRIVGKRQDYYVPTPKTEVNESSGPLDGMKLFFENTLKINTNQPNVEIDIEFLKQNGITLAVLIDEIGIKISDMYAGDILRSFSDLVEIGFQSKDLVRNRKLFNCDMLGNLYKTDYTAIKERGVKFDLHDIVVGGFWASDLAALEYNLDEAIESGEIILNNLKILNFSLSGLILIGLTKEHLKKLKIGKREAFDLGWDLTEYQQFLS